MSKDKLDLHAFEEDLGLCSAPVAVAVGGSASYSEETRHKEDVSTFLERLRAVDSSQNPSLTKGPEKAYLKDFHFAQQAPELAEAVYHTPPCFREDLLNWWWAGGARGAFESLRASAPFASLSAQQLDCLAGLFPSEDDFRFLYLGMAGTGTGLHHDVICSHSWSGQISGFKLWILFHPSCTQDLVNSATGDCLADDIWAAAPGNVLAQVRALVRSCCQQQSCELPSSFSVTHSCSTHPAVDGSVWSRAYLAIQPPQTAMFVPSGWYHQVHNLTRSLSINHNWFDSSALEAVCDFIIEEAAEVRKRIDDCRTPGIALEADCSFAVLCERVMRADIRCNIAQLCLLLSLVCASCNESSRVSEASRPLLYSAEALRVAVEACAGKLATEPLVCMATSAESDLHLRGKMTESGLCIVTDFLGGSPVDVLT